MSRRAKTVGAVFAVAFVAAMVTTGTAVGAALLKLATAFVH